MSNFAIIECGGKQYGVTEGDTIRVESLPGDEGDTLEIDTVKLLSLDGVVTLGGPNVKGASVSAQVVSKGKAKKVIVFKYKAKTRYRKKNGHRQNYTDLRVSSITKEDEE
tara:strand:+ start:285 stop:614 length:330 start_codon:yes stop_codon:yes gene_type:complete